MRRFFLIIFLTCFSLRVFANQTEYPPITAENVMNLREVETIGQGALYSNLAWSPDGRRIVTGGARGFFLFDSNYQNIGFIDMGKPVDVLRFAPDGSFVFAAFDGKINAFDLQTGMIRYHLNGGSILAISQNGRLVAYSSHRSVVVADVATGETRYVLDYSTIWETDYSDGYSHRMTSITFAQFFNNDEQVLIHWYFEEVSEEGLWGSHYTRNDVWTLADNSRETIWDEDDTSSSRYEDEFVAFDANNDSFRLNSSYWRHGEQRVDLFPSELELLLAVDDPYQLLIDNLYAAPVGTWSENENSYYNQIDASQTGVWNIQTGDLIAIFPALGRISFSPDKTKIAITNQIFDLATTERLAFLQNDTYHVLSGVNDRILQYGADDSLRLLDAISMEEIAILPMLASELKEVKDIFSDDSLLFVDKNEQLFIRISGTTGAEIARIEVDRAFPYPRLTQDERYFYREYSGAGYVLDGIWDANTGEHIEFPPAFVPLLTSFENNQVIGWTGETIGFYDLSLRDYVEEISLAATTYEDRGQPSELRMSSDGQYLAIFFNLEGLVIRRSTSELITNFVGGAAFNPSSTLLAYTDSERNVSIMNLADGRIIQHWYLAGSTSFAARLYFQTDVIFSANFGGWDGGNEVLYYNALTGAQTSFSFPYIQSSQTPVPFAESNGLRFYIANGLRIEWNDQPISLTLNPANFSSASLSSDGTKLYINYTDGTFSIWAVGE